ncbi:RecB family exonuclease [Pseudodesulfovibrio portus]|nr:PD-(D/E)XK nuclease family protein [Pseudodesulfovibrio portus]
MKIHVGYLFDGGSFPGELGNSEAAEGVMTTGPLGLVSILETRLGIPACHHGQPVRIARYLAAMDDCCKTDEPFYKKSFEADGWSAARSLLVLRDQLRLSGWDGHDPGASARLMDMATLEKSARVLPGLAERIEDILGSLAIYGISGISEIVLHVHDVTEWPSCWRRLFVALEEKGIPLGVWQPDVAPRTSTDLDILHERLCTSGNVAATFQADGSIVRLSSATALEAADALGAWLAVKDDSDGDLALIVESGAEVLDAAMCRHGLPRPGGGSRSQWRAALQLLPLGLGIHWAPFDPQSYLEFLTAPICPLHPAMAGHLVRVLEQAPGMGGKKWIEAVGKCEEWARKQDDGETLLEDLRFWTGVKRVSPHVGLDVETICTICQRLSDWAAKGAQSLEGRLMGAVSGMALELAEAVRETGRKAIPKPQLDRMLDSVIGGGASIADKAEASPWAVLTHPGQLGDRVDTVIWWDFTMEGMPSCRLPWTNAELTALNNAGVHMDDMDLHRNLELSSWQQAVCNTHKRLVLVMPEQDGGEPLPPHPFWENIVAVMNLSGDTDIPAMTVSASQLRKGDDRLMGRIIPLELVVENAALEFQQHWEAPAGTVARREKESPSGMSQLIKCPLAWVLTYVLDVGALGSPALSEGNQLIGSFCHSIVEDLINESRTWKSEDAVARAVALFDSRLREMAAVYLLPGMETAREQLRSRLKRAVSDLFERIGNAKLSVLESERRVERIDESGQTYRGFVDISLEDDKGNPVVWDMKWTNKSKYRREEMEKGIALQLAAYCWMLDKDDLPAFGAYYMLAQTELISSQAPWLPPESVVNCDLKATWKMVRERYDAIIDRLMAGEVEAIAPSDDEEEKEFDFGTGCFFCDYAMVCGVGYE